MAVRAGLVLALLLVAMMVPGLDPFGLSPGAPAPHFSLDMGFGPQELVNVSELVPIYALGDNLWMGFSYNQSSSFSLFAPGGVAPVANQTVQPGSVFLLHTFGQHDPIGSWTLTVRSAFILLARIPFAVVPSGGANPPGSPVLTGSTVSPNGSLSLAFAMDTGLAHGLEACLLGSDSGAAAVVTLPSQVGNFSLSLVSANGSLTGRFAPTAGAGQPPPFDLWVELRYLYSFSSPSDPALQLGGEELVASTQPETFSSPLAPANFTIPLDAYAHLRDGKYSVVVYFRNHGGLFLEQTTVLFLGGSWVWLGGCSPLVSAGPLFKAEVPLRNFADWPYRIFVSYADNGTQGYVKADVPTNLTSVAVDVVPWGGKLPAGYTLGIVSNKSVSAFQAFNSTMFVQSRSLPAYFEASVSFHGVVVDAHTFNLTGKYETLNWDVPLGKLQVAVQLDTEPVQGSTVRVLGPSGVVESGKTGTAGTISFLLPAGNYTVESTFGNATSAKQAAISAGEESTVLFSSVSSVDYTPDYVLGAVAVLAAAANLWVWLRLPRRRA